MLDKVIKKSLLIYFNYGNFKSVLLNDFHSQVCLIECVHPWYANFYNEVGTGGGDVRTMLIVA